MGYNDNKNAKSSQGEKGSSGRKRKDKGLQTFVVALSLLTTLCLLISIRSHVAVYPLRLATDECKEAGEDLLDGMVYICNGKGCDSSFLCYSMSLLRFESNWQGPIYVISDRQDFISGTACDQNRPRYSVVVAPETPTMMHMKNFKRQLFDLIPAKNATSLIYIDLILFRWVACTTSSLRRPLKTWDSFATRGVRVAINFSEALSTCARRKRP